MARASIILSEDQFQCSICLDVFTEPVSMPCGHNFCEDCYTLLLHDKTEYQCPLCNRKFKVGLRLNINTAFRDVVESFKKHQVAADSDVPVGPRQVPCDWCPDNKMKASKTCLVCLASFCKLHLEPHQRVAAFTRHKLVDPVENLQDKVCKEHSGILELPDRTDQTHVCIVCEEYGPPAAVPVEGGHVDREVQVPESPEEEKINERGWRRTRGRRQRNKRGKSEKKDVALQPHTERSLSVPLENAWSNCSIMPGSKGASFGRWYYEVHTEGKTCWDIGVMRESARQDGNHNCLNGKWIIRFGYCNYRALHIIPVLGRNSEVIIVLVDHEKGTVSFYDARTAALLHIFTGCEFQERVYLFFKSSHARGSCWRRRLTPVEKRQNSEEWDMFEILILFSLCLICWLLTNDTV